MTNTKWLKRALLGGVALGVMASGAQADELADLKAQLENLQSRVNELEQRPSAPVLPEGASFITMSRGTADFPNYGTQAKRDEINTSPSRGFTIAITPTADLPAPVAEVVVYGYVKGDVIYDFDGIKLNTFSVPAIWSNPNRGDEHWRFHAFQSRFGIRSRTDTAIGQIRSTIEGDFFGAPFASDLGEFRLRHAYGEWDITPAWTFLAGQTWRTADLHPLGIGTVDFSGYAGPNSYPRAGQVRMTYHAGPISWAVAIEQPTFGSSASWPNLSSYLQFDAPGGHQFIITGAVADHSDSEFSEDFGWAVQAGANINLADIATLSVAGLYGDQEHCTYLAQTFCPGGFDPQKTDPLSEDDEFFFSETGWGVFAGLSFGITDTTTFNVVYGITQIDNDAAFSDIDDVTTQTVHANILWRPVQQMQLGWEVMWGDYDFNGGDWDDDDVNARQSDDAMRAQFGAWFFF